MRKTPSWPRSGPTSAWANLHLLGRPNTFLALHERGGGEADFADAAGAEADAGAGGEAGDEASAGAGAGGEASAGAGAGAGAEGAGSAPETELELELVSLTLCETVCVLLTTQNSPLPCRPPPPFPYSITSAPLALQEEARGRSLKGWAYSPLGGPEAPRVQWLGQIISLARLHRGVRGFAGRAT